jgi:predicted nucleic acid-binding protein
VARLQAGVGGSLVLDAEGIVKLAFGDSATRYQYEAARNRRAHVLTAASTLAEVLRGQQREAALHRVLNRITVVPVDAAHGRAAGELLGKTGLAGPRCALDALLAAVALSQPRPTVLLASDPADLARLTDEPDRPRAEQIAVIKV